MADLADDKPLTEADLANMEDDSADFDDDEDNPTWADGEDDSKDVDEEEDSDPAPKRKEQDEEDDSDSDDASGSEDDEDPEDDSKDDSEEEDSADQDEDPVAKAIEAERKKHNDEMAKARIEAKKAQEEAAATRKAATESAIQRYIDEAGDDEAERKARENDVQQFRLQEEQIVLNDERLQTGIERAVASIPLFNTKNSVIQAELLDAVDEFEDRFVVKDKYGRPKEIKVDPATGKRADIVSYLKTKADKITRMTGIRGIEHEKSKKAQKSRTITPGGRSHAAKKGKSDPEMDAFDEEANKW